MRVIAGKARSLPLAAPEGMETRPTTDRIKETLFNILNPLLADCVFVDAFSGSGGIGIEALSRGAARCYFVESDRRAVACIEKNLEFTRLKSQAVVLKQDVSAALRSIGEPFADVIFMDPPYGKELEVRALEILRDLPYVTAETLLVIEASREADFSWTESLGFSVCREKCYKTNKHVFVKRRTEE